MADNLPQLSPSQLDTKTANNSIKQISSTLGGHNDDELTRLKKDSLSGGVGQLKAALRNRLRPSNLTSNPISNPTDATNSNTILSDNNDESASVTYHHHKNNGNLVSGSSNHNGNHIQQNRSDLPAEKNSSKKLNNSTLNKNKLKVEEKEYSEILNDEDEYENEYRASDGVKRNDDDDEDDENGVDDDEDDEEEEDEEEQNNHRSQVIFPGYVPVAFRYFKQNTQPRFICLKMITSPWFERISMFIILINCITLGMYQPCNDNPCKSTRCVILQYLDHIIFIFFGVEMCIKLMAMGFWGKDTYLADTWNRLDMFIVIAGTIEYLVASENLSLSAIRTVRVLRPLRAINRVPSMRILVMLLLDTLPMLGNVLLLCFFVFFIFGIVGVQLWKGVLRNRCFFEYNYTLMAGLVPETFHNTYFTPEHTDSFICTTENGAGMSTCADIPPLVNNSIVCNNTVEAALSTHRNPFTRAANSCINWNIYYSKCKPSAENPFKGAISFDNIGFAWVAIFQIISLESWVTIMYYIQDAHSFWNWVYFIFLIVIGSFFMINLCLVVIATQFSETKKRETERMIAERRRFSRSTSTLLSDSANEPGSCWEEFLKYLGHLLRKSKRRVVKKYTKFRNNRKKHLIDREPTLKLRAKVDMAAIKEEGEEGVVAIVGRGDEELAMMATPEASLTPNNENPDSYTTENECEGGNAPKIVQRAPINQQRTLNLNDSAIMSASVGGPKQLANTPSNAEDYVYYCYSATGAAGGEEVLDETETHMRPKSLLEQHAKRKSERSSGGKICCFCCCFCCAKRLASTRLCRFLTSFQRRLKDFVDGKFFQRTILFAILINTLSMGIEHHQQPQKLTLILEYSNMFFSGVFLIEMILKLLAYGIFDYIKNAFNLFDGAIVGISCYEVIRQLTNAGGADGVSSGPSGVSVLRTFRLLRILKLVRFMPALRRQLLVMLKTVDNVATFFSLLILFIFIFSILGMNLFGCKFCELTDGERVCERKNFDSLLWAILTVFQVLTQEDWNEVLYNSMYKTSSWAALYYIALMTFGNYVLFNLLVAILVEGFSTEDEPKKALEERIIEDAIHAIQEQERQSRHSGGSRRGSRRGRSRKGSKACSQEGGGEARKSISHNREEAPLIPSQSELPNEASNTKANSDTISETPSAKMLIQLPIITHTSPTPISSPGNSPRVSRSRLADNNPRLDARLATDKAFRKHSLDSFYLSRKKNRPLPKSKTFTTSPTNQQQQQQQQIDEISRPTNISLTQIFIPQRLPTTNNANTKPLNPPKIMIETHEGEIKPITPETPQIDTNEKEPTTTKTVQIEEAAFIKSHPAIERNRATSKSFNEKSLLAIPKIRYKHQRSKSEKSKSHKSRTQSTDSESMRNNLSDYQLSSNATDESAEQQLPVLSTTDRTVLIQKSPPYNVDIVGTSDPTAKADSVRTRINSTSTSTRRSVKSAAKNQKKTYEQEDDDEMIDFNCCGNMPRPKGCFKSREEYSLYIFSKENKFRLLCKHVAEQKWFDYTILLFISLNCITLAMERPTIPPGSLERKFLTNSNYLFTVIFAIEMSIKVLANGFFVGERAYLTSGWNIMDCFLVVISLVDVAVSLTARSSPKIFGILRVFRLLRTLRPLRMISRAPGLKLVVQTLLSSLRPIGNIVLICCTFFIIFGILGVQLFKGKLFRCIGEDVKNIRTKDECLAVPGNQWVNSQYNFDNLGLALMALFVLSSKDGWVQIMYTGIDAVGIDRQPIVNYNEWMLLYFISFLLLVGFFVLNMFVGVVIENFHKCREQQEREEKARRAAKRAKKFEEKRRKMREIPYYASYSKTRRLLHDICNSKYFDLIIAGVIGLNVVSMSLEFYMMPKFLEEVLDVFNFVFTIIFLLEAIVRIVAIGFFRYFKERWNQLDILIVIMSIAGIIFDKLDSRKTIPINPTIIRVMRVLRIARVLKLLKMAKGIRSLLDTVIQALPQVGNLGLLFFLLFFIFAILGVELFGRLNCESTNSACDGLSKHAHFHNFGMAFLTLFRIATGDNWNGIMKDTLRENQLCQDDNGVVSSSMCLASVLAPIYFVIFVLMAQFVLVNVVVAVLMKHLDESNKMMADDAEMDEEIERQLEAEARNNIYDDTMQKLENDFDSDIYNPYAKQSSLPPNFTFDLNQPKSPSQHENTSYEQATLHSNQSENTSTNEETTSDNAANKKTKSGEDMELNRLTQNDQENTDRPLSVTSSSTATSSAIKYKSILKHHHSSCSNQAKEAVQTSSRRASAGYGASSGRQSGNNNQQLLDNESNLSILNESDSVSCIMSMRQANKENRPYSIKYDAVADSDVFNSSNSNLSAGSFNANNSTSSPSSNHQHFSPRSSMKIKVIDENDTNDTDN